MTSSTPERWFVCARPEPQPRLRLFCFPYAGGGPPIFRAWPEGLPAGVEVWAARFPGRGARLKEVPFTRIGPLVEALAAALEPYLNRPFAFFGHSLGALVGFELARELRRRDRPLPAHLFVSGCGAPHIPYPHPPIHALPDPAFLEELRRLEGTPAEVLAHRELMQLLLPALRADFALRETYTCAPEPPLDLPITAFGGMEDERVNGERLEAWREQTTKAFTLHMLPGDHFFLNTARSLILQMLGRELGPYLERVA